MDKLSSINCDFPYIIAEGRMGVDEKISLSAALL